MRDAAEKGAADGPSASLATDNEAGGDAVSDLQDCAGNPVE